MPVLPLAVTVGFSGPRHWFSPEEHPGADPAAFESAAAEWLTNRLATLPGELGLQDHYFLTGISQIAIGGDHAFTRACRDLDIPQLISLPQPRDAYLDARGSTAPDFTPEEQERSITLLESPHIFSELVVGESPDRHERFQEANIELVRKSDVIIAMVKPDTTGKTGGTWDVVRQARRWATPVLLVTVSLQKGCPTFAAEWEGGGTPAESGYRPPQHPDILRGVSLEGYEETARIPSKDSYFAVLKQHTSRESAHYRSMFQNAARFIIGTHSLATVCAVTTLVALQGNMPKQVFYLLLAAILLAELIFLVAGYVRHHKLHESSAAPLWATNQLLGEVARSVIAFGRYHVGFAHLWTLGLPSAIRPILRTMEILQLRETRNSHGENWKECRDTYLATRLTEPKAQIDYYTQRAAAAEHSYHRAHLIFIWASRSAICATFLKLGLIIIYCCVGNQYWDLAKALLGFAGVVLPVVAVAALSLAAANDLEARHHTFSEMRDFLEHQAELLKEASNEREFKKLLSETESRLLGETVTWYSRRSYTGVA